MVGTITMAGILDELLNGQSLYRTSLLKTLANNAPKIHSELARYSGDNVSATDEEFNKYKSRVKRFSRGNFR